MKLKSNHQKCVARRKRANRRIHKTEKKMATPYAASLAEAMAAMLRGELDRPGAFSKALIESSPTFQYILPPDKGFR